MSNRGTSMAFAFGLVVLIVASAFYLPAIVEEPTDNRTLAVNQTEGETITVYKTLNATLVDVHDTQANATVELKDTDTGATNSTTIADGSSETLTLEGSEITIEVRAINTTDSAELTYTYPPTYSWPEPMKTVADNLAIIVMGLVAFVLFAFVWVE